MFEVPPQLAAGLTRAYGEAGGRWVRSLPGRIARLCAEWGLQLIAGERPAGEWNLILFVRRGHEPCVLKIFGPDANAADEATALTAWAGHGSVRALEVSPDGQAVLLERLEPARSLHHVGLLRAGEIAGALIRTLAVSAPAGLPLLTDVAREHAETFELRQDAQDRPLPAHWIDLATQLASELATDTGTTLVHGDLHYGNILAGTRVPWLAIDPKPAVGHPERCVPELLWTRIDEAPDRGAVHDLCAALVRTGNLNENRTWAWTVVQTVHYWLWALSAGLTEDPIRCRRLLDALA